MAEAGARTWKDLVQRIEAMDKKYKRSDNLSLQAASQHQADKGAEVNLAACDLDAVDVELICDNILDEGSVVESLVLGGNPKIGDAGAEILAAALASNTKLKVLHLFECGLTDDGGGYLASSLREHMAIKELLIYKNGLSEACEQYMRECLAHKRKFFVCSLSIG